VFRSIIANEAAIYYAILNAYDPLVNNIFRREIELRHHVRQSEDLLQSGCWNQQPDAYQAFLDIHIWALKGLDSLLEEKKTLATDTNYMYAILAAMPQHNKILSLLSVAQCSAYQVGQQQAGLENEIAKNAMKLLATFQVENKDE